MMRKLMILVLAMSPAVAQATEFLLPDKPIPAEIHERAEFQQAVEDGKLCREYAGYAVQVMDRFYTSSERDIYARCMKHLGHALPYTASERNGRLVFNGEQQ